MTIHINSKLSFKELQLSLGKRQGKILQAVTSMKKLVTDRQVKELLELDDMNQVRPRISELLRLGVLKEGKAIKCPITGRKVRRVKR
jgi:hypothetical protein